MTISNDGDISTDLFDWFEVEPVQNNAAEELRANLREAFERRIPLLEYIAEHGQRECDRNWAARRLERYRSVA